MPSDDTKKAHRKPKRSYAGYVKQLLPEDASINGEALAVVSSMTNDILRSFANECKSLLQHSHKKTVTKHDVLFALRALVHEKKMFEAAEAYMKNNISAYEKSVEDEAKGRLTERAKLVFPAARIGSMLRDERIGARVSPTAAVALASVAEFFVGILLDNADEKRKTDKVARITARHVRLALADTELGALCDGTVKHGGVIPCMRVELLPKTAGKRKAACADDENCVQECPKPKKTKKSKK